MYNLKTKHILTLFTLCCLLFSHQLVNAQCHIDDWTALKAFYESTNGDNWKSTTGWEVIKVNEPPLNCNLKNLFGITINENGRVESIEFYLNYLTGFIPAEIGKLSDLKILDLERNNLGGKIPNELGRLKKLQILKLGISDISGEIPNELGNLTKLVELNFSFNNLNGNIPPELGNLNSLVNLALHNTNISGSIPPELGKLSNLTDLNLRKNNLSGNIPAALGNLVNLVNLDLDYNQLSGIAPELGNLNNLERLLLQHNQLSGIPAELGNLNNLESLSLNNNQIIGSIPPELGKLSNLWDLSLYSNKLSGEIPPELGNLTNLYKLDLSLNRLSGGIPSELGNLINLKHLTLFYNKLTSEIPLELFNLTQLSTLSLNYNQLKGIIPSEIGNLIDLTVLYLHNNQLSGNIPAELGNLSKISSLILNNNQLSGSIPPELGNLNINILNLSNNQLINNIPPELGNLSRLKNLALSNNQLSGNLPPELGNLRNLAQFFLNENKLEGTIPSSISNLIELYHFDVSRNQLSGAIPNLNPYTDEFIELVFDIRFNNFSCVDINSFNYTNFHNDPTPIGFLAPIFKYAPQNYGQSNSQSFLIKDSLTAISLSVPINIQGNLEYQWYLNELPLDGATDSILVVNNVQLSNVGDYTLRIIDIDCSFESTYYSAINYYQYISDPISVRRTDLEGCTDEYSCNYNQFAMIDDGSCEYVWCDTLTNPIKIKTTNEQILSENQITFDLVIDSLNQDYSADGLTFTLDTRGNYKIESIDVINPALSITEVDVSQLYANTLSIDRTKTELLVSNSPLLRVTALIIIEDIPTDEETCSHFHISGGTELSSGHFISFDNVYIDIPFSSCSPYGGNGVESKNWLPLVLTISPQNCKTNTNSLVEIKILEEGQSPFSYILSDENDSAVLENTSIENLFAIEGLNAGNYQLTVTDANGKTTTLKTCIPLIANLNGNEPCNSSCVDYVTVPNGAITGNHQAKKELEIKGYVGKNETVEFSICD